ncbi:MAG: hypothetical protein AAFP84_10075, partial [Actinomycetota bacterium]
GSWVADALWGSEYGPSESTPSTRAAEIHWLTASGATTPIVLDERERVDADDVSRLVVEARRTGLRFAVWSEEGPVRRPSIALTAALFTGQPPRPVDEAVQVERANGSVTVTIAERQPRQPWFLIMIPVLIVTFAWLFFLVVGGLGRTLREIWERGVSGVSQRTVADFVDGSLRVRAERNGTIIDEVEMPIADVAAVATLNGLTACTTTGAVPLPNDWGTTDVAVRRSLTESFATALNIELEAI